MHARDELRLKRKNKLGDYFGVCKGGNNIISFFFFFFFFGDAKNKGKKKEKENLRTEK